MNSRLRSREELAMDFLDYYDDEEFNKTCQELARLILGEDEPIRCSNKMAVLDEVLHSAYELKQKEFFGGRTALEILELDGD